MKIRGLVAGLSLALATSVCAEDKASARIEGTVEVEGIDFSGKIVGDSVPSYARHPVTGKVSVVTKRGRVHRVETFTSWDAENGVHGQVWERLYVSGGSFTGWTERLIQTPDHIVFSRNVINGDFEQKIRKDGSGFVEWTVTGGDNQIDDSDDDFSDADADDDSDSTSSVTSSDAGSDSGNSADGNLPTVEIMEEGEFDGVSDRRIEIDAHRGHHPKIRFRDEGYARMELTDDKKTESKTVNQKLKLDGRGKGDLSFVPTEKDKDQGSPTPTPAPTATPLPGATPVSTPTPDDPTTDDDTTDDDTLF